MIDLIKQLIEKAVGTDASFSVQVSADKMHGDYATNVALALAKKIGKNPREVAQDIAAKIGKKNFLEKIEIAGPGFINFYLSKDYFIDQLKSIDKHFGSSDHAKRFKVIVEYTDPNPFKLFHVGHLMNNAIGESISRIMEMHGVNLKRANYQGDVGMHVAKALYGKLKNPSYSWQDAYVFGSKEYDEHEQAKAEMALLNKQIFEKSNKKVNALYAQGRKESLAAFEKMYKKLGTKFDYYFFESEVADFGKKIVLEGLKKGIFEKGEKGAIVFKGEKVALHTRVFINSEGLPTYEAKELGLANVKYKKFKYDHSVIVTANEINEYFKVLLAAMEQVFPDLAKKTKHIGHGILRLPEGKMSSRTGKVVTAESLIEKVKAIVTQKAADKKLDEKTIEMIAIGAIKYSILKQSIGGDIIFDLEKSVSFDGDSGPYLQYAYVRAVSVLAKAKAEKVKASFKKPPGEIGQLEKMMVRFPEVIEKAGQGYEPHLIVTYLTELAREFNAYYAHHKIVDKADEFSPYKVAITEAFSIIMKNGLWLLGIQAPEKM